MRGSNVRSERGQTMSEYAIILAVITATIVLALAFLSSQIAAVLQRVASMVG
jgi:Flp pilus assembly pilin Flp